MFETHYRLTCSGTLFEAADPVERFTFGVCLRNEGGGATGVKQPNQDQFDNLVSDTTAFFSRSDTGIKSTARLTEVKLARIGADGKYIADPMIAGVNVQGGMVGGNHFPAQIALAVSLTTARRGPTGKGRFYLPAPAWGIDVATGLVAAPNADQTRASARTWLLDLQNEPGIDAVGFRVVVASSKGYNSDVTGVRVGRALDTIRSRRRSLEEAYGQPLAL